MINTPSYKHSQGKFSQGLQWYLAALSVMIIGLLLAAHRYPGGFDWAYSVASALMSQKHNPAGSYWFAAGLSLSMLLLWPYVSALQRALSDSPSRVISPAINAIRLGLICGILLGIERLLIYDLSHWLYKSHEVLALLCFAGLYFGILLLLFLAMLRHKRYLIPVLLVVSPLLAIGISQFWLYVEQRDLGWVDASWRQRGIPVWLSFALWQWLAIVFLWLGLALLSFTSKATTRE